MKNLFVLFFSLLNTIPVFTYSSFQVKEKHTETITKEISFEKNGDNIFMIENVVGDLEVEGYNGNTVKIEVEKIIEADNNADLKKGIQEIQLGTFQNDQGMILFTDAPFVSFDKSAMEFQYDGVDKMNMGNCNNGYMKYGDYDFTMNYKVKVPRNVNVRLDNLSGHISLEGINGDIMKINSTSGMINLNQLKIDNISIANMSGHITGEKIETKELVANSMSGHIKLYEVKADATEAKSMSGHVIMTFDENPTKDSQFETMSGHVEVTFQPELNANINQHVGGNGKCSSEFMNNSEKMSDKIFNNSSNKKGNCSSTCKGVKMGDSMKYKSGTGGPDFKFSTSNGHVKLRRA